MEQLLRSLKKDFPHLSFMQGATFYWSPEDQAIFYKSNVSTTTNIWSLLHETGHALLQHSSYHLDFELLQLEVAAWQKAKELAGHYNHQIDEDHMEDCLDSYRDWLHRRSMCPSCGVQSAQQSPSKYHCFNCHSVWQVTNARFCRPYRQAKDNKKSPFEAVSPGDFLY